MGSELSPARCLDEQLAPTLASKLDCIAKANVGYFVTIQAADRANNSEDQLMACFSNLFSHVGNGVKAIVNRSHLDHFHGENSESLSLERSFHMEGEIGEAFSGYVNNVRETYIALVDAISSCRTLDELEAVRAEYMRWASQYMRNTHEEMGDYCFIWNSTPPELLANIYRLALTKLTEDALGGESQESLDYGKIKQRISDIEEPHFPIGRKGLQEKFPPLISAIIVDLIEQSPGAFVKAAKKDNVSCLTDSLYHWVNGFGGSIGFPEGRKLVSDVNESVAIALHLIYLRSKGDGESIELSEVFGLKEGSDSVKRAIEDVKQEVEDV